MKKIILLSILTALCFSQTEEWIYYNKIEGSPGTYSPFVYRIKPDGTENEIIMENVMMSDISEDGLKILFINNYGAIYLVNLESMDTTIVDFGEGSGSHEARFTYDENVIVYLDRYTIGMILLNNYINILS